LQPTTGRQPEHRGFEPHVLVAVQPEPLSIRVNLGKREIEAFLPQTVVDLRVAVVWVARERAKDGFLGSFSWLLFPLRSTRVRRPKQTDRIKRLVLVNNARTTHGGHGLARIKFVGLSERQKPQWPMSKKALAKNRALPFYQRLQQLLLRIGGLALAENVDRRIGQVEHRRQLDR